ncbi:P-loop containing nucleoside triphosphate hydrolase protein [Gymnopus androsaceus JB14]|uniref:P-loop containing nucleoside triphosphate hydrolase protein n=1 Tax=Gymnopus androsaceus JB14 TaxID=1447944 RepID=A0A6A4IAS6_9AGAR|nr:P-loop containing nucleoside triphosphate hydrolase protein [Gymnopus androsaceus JB14]
MATLSSDVQVAIPGYAALLSFVLLAAQLVLKRWSASSSPGHAAEQTYQVLRIVGCLSLLVLTALPLSCKHCGTKDEHVLAQCSGLQVLSLLTYIYATSLAFLSAVTVSIRWRAVLTRHLGIVLLVTWIVYGYYDLFPLATFAQSPSHSCQGWLLWTKIGILTFTGIVIPLAIPREYVPVDPKHPMPVQNPEQTASIFSLGTFFFLDPVVFEAYRVPHLPFTSLPPLADSDAAKNLKEAHFRHLDPFSGAKPRNILFNLIRTFPYESMLLWWLLLISAVFSLVEPVAVNELLREEGTKMRPWFWVLLLFSYPLADSLVVEWYLRVCMQTIVRLEAILTQLVFEHALRIRVNADSSESDTGNKKSVNAVGKINNLVTTDLAIINDARNCIVLISQIPALLFLYTAFLYTVLGWSAFVGIGLTILMAPIPIYLSNIIRKYQAIRMKKTDARVHVFTDMMNILRMIKLFSWEKRMLSKLSEARQEELRLLKKRQYANLLGSVVNFAIPIIAMATTYATQTLVMKQELNASTVFSSLVVFESLRSYINAIFMYWTRAQAAKVSLDRITDFLLNTELLNGFDPPSSAQALDMISTVQPSMDEIGFQSAAFTWSEDSGGTATPSSRKFMLKIENKLSFKKGCINLVTGPTGSGKSSLLVALLGEMHFIPSGPNSFFHLPRGEGIAYAAQESWVQNETIKNNILFASEYNEARYKEVIHACGLERDLELFEAGDETEVGEKGLTLSGGQKARLTLARAIYSKANILLLDDVLAALDVHTSKWIVEKCLASSLVKDRTVILVTHNVELVEPIASFVVSMKEGQISEQRHRTPVSNNTLYKALHDAVVVEESGDLTKGDSKPDGKLVVAEEIQEGRISGNSVQLYTTAVGGKHAILYFSTLLAMMLLTHLMGIVQTWFLGYWASQYERPGKVSVVFYLGVYGESTLFGLFISGTIRASQRIHKQLAEVIFGTTMRWLDKTPTSRIVTRFTQDINTIDTSIPEMTKLTVDQTFRLILKLTAIIILTPIFLIPGIAALAIGFICGTIYLKAQMSVKREMSVAKAPQPWTGLISIRAYGAQTMVTEQLLSRIDKYSRSARVFYNLQRWMALRMHVLSAVFIGTLAWYLVYVKKDSASNTGFSINMGATFTGAIFGWVVNMNMLEGQSNSLERVDAYLQIEQEPKATEQGKPPAYWPASGDLRVENLCARYSPDGPEILHNLSFHIKSGERIGVVGRTGSGKSSLALSLLRCIYTTGEVMFDGISTSSTNLDSLRSKITIIPQVPELISGTLRQNLDPFEEVDDLTLNDSLRAAGLTALQEDLAEDEDKITLDTAISGGGSNLSVGQRQIVALARAMVRSSKLLILDEDYKTDNIIQTSLRNELKGNVTLITIAHRLQSIMDANRIMVLDAGNLVEFGAPSELLKQEDGRLRALVEESNDKEKLFMLAEAAR